MTQLDLRELACLAPSPAERAAAVREIAKASNRDAETLIWLQELAQGETECTVALAIAESIACYGDHNPSILVWFKTYAQYARHAAARSAALRCLAEGWKDEFNVFEILYKCAIGDPFCPKPELATTNPRKVALSLLIEHYPDDDRVEHLTLDRAANDSDPAVRKYATAQAKALSFKA